MNVLAIVLAAVGGVGVGALLLAFLATRTIEARRRSAARRRARARRGYIKKAA